MLAFYLTLVDNPSDQEKVKIIYTKYYGLMKHIALEYTKNDADDIVHDAMIKIIQNIEKVDITDEQKAKSFCTAVVRNRALDVLKKGGKESASFCDEIKAEENFTYTFTDIGETYQILYKALDSLDDTYKTVCTLKYVNELTEREIAEVLGLSQKTVSVRIFRGKQILKKQLRKEDFYA